MGGLDPPIQLVPPQMKLDGVRTLPLLTKAGHDEEVYSPFNSRLAACSSGSV